MMLSTTRCSELSLPVSTLNKCTPSCRARYSIAKACVAHRLDADMVANAPGNGASLVFALWPEPQPLQSFSRLRFCRSLAITSVWSSQLRVSQMRLAVQENDAPTQMPPPCRFGPVGFSGIRLLGTSAPTFRQYMSRRSSPHWHRYKVTGSRSGRLWSHSHRCRTRPRFRSVQQ